MSERVDPELELLYERARILAQPVRSEEAKLGHDHVVFVIDDRRYALDVRFVLEIALAGEVLKIPRVPPFLGVTALRGQYVAVVDLLRWVGTHSGRRLERPYVIICGETQREIALLVDEVLDLRPLDVDHLLAAESRARCALVEEDLWVLDARALLADARLSEEREATSQDIRGA